MGGGNRGRKKRGVWKIICNFAHYINQYSVNSYVID